MTEIEHRNGGEYSRPTYDFESYRLVCDTKSGGFRKVGIVDSEGYREAQHNKQTIFGVMDGKRIPVLTPLQHISGYDTERCLALTGKEVAYLLSVPPSLLGEISLDNSMLPPERNFSVIVESIHEETDTLKRELPLLLGGLAEMTPRDFINPEVPEVSRQAAMNMYSVCVGAEDEGKVRPRRDMGFVEAFFEELAAIPQDRLSTVLLTSDDLSQDMGFVNELWDIYQARFDWLGQHHPVSMEDTKAFFERLLLDEDTYTIVRFDEQGKPACIGSFMTGIEKCEWLLPGFIWSAQERARSEDEEIIYYPEIVSDARNIQQHYSRDVIHLFGRILARRGGAYRVLFESTNVSSRYIPPMMERYIESSRAQGGVGAIEPMQKIDQLDYWFLTPIGD